MALSQESLRMKVVAILLSAAFLTCAAPSYAQYADEQRNPHEYTQEDSHPIKFLSYLLAPIGFVLDWTVARPMHYLSTESALAPVYGNQEDDTPAAMPPLAQIPPDNFSANTASSLRDQSLTPPVTKRKIEPVFPQASAQPAPAPAAPSVSGSSQPVLH